MSTKGHWCYDKRYGLPSIVKDSEVVRYTVKGRRIQNRVESLAEREERGLV